MERLNKVLKKFDNKKILVIGDLMLDHYIHGKVERISAEAPVPIVDVNREDYKLGGASNVVYNLRSLGANPFVVGVIGDDIYGQKITDLLQENNINTSGIVIDKNRKSTLKTRIVAHHQQIARIDFETRDFLDSEIETEIICKIEKFLPEVDAILFEDYNKGLITKEIIRFTIDKALKSNKIITVDPKFINFFDYTDVTVFKPNLKELQENLKVKINSKKELIDAGSSLFSKMNMKYLVITLSEDGLIILSKNGDVYEIPTFAKEVFDVSGAGDTVISTLTLGLTAGLDIREASEIANHAAGAVCGKSGIAPVTKQDILTSYKREHYES